MGSVSAAAALQLPVRLQDIELGRPTDLLLEADTWRALGFVVHCRDESRRFLPFMAAQPLEDEIEVASALLLLEDVAFYEQRAVSFRSLVGTEVDGGLLQDIVISASGEVGEIVVEAAQTAA